MGKKQITEHQAARYLALMEALKRDSDSVKVAAARLGIGADQFSNISSGRREPGFGHLWLAYKSLDITIDFFDRDSAVVLPSELSPRKNEPIREQLPPHMRQQELMDMLRDNPEVDAYFHTPDGEDTPIGIRLQLASVDWSTMGMGRRPTHDEIHKLRVIFQEMVKDSL